MKIVQPWNYDLRNWQIAAARKVKEKYDKNEIDFLCVATPGAGKTIFALRIAHYLLSRNRIKRVVIVCPTEHLKKQWAESAFSVGIDIDPNFENSAGMETPDYFGVSLTYAQVGRMPKVHKRNTEKEKTFVIFDEIHHLGDDLSWGDAVRSAFDKAAYRLAISGTPFRRDNNAIPFIKYKKAQSIADFVYGYSDAIRDKVCRPVYFPAYEGEMEWRVKDKVYKATFANMLKDAQASERLRTALDPKGKWLRTVITDADKKLNEIRNDGHPDAGALIISIDQTHAKKVARLLEELTGSKAVLVVSDDPKASSKIKLFNDSNQKWLIAVKMVSEGVDIPRLRVGVFATNIKSELFFRQAVGRFVRQQNDLKKQHAFFFIPKDIVIVDYAQKIEEEREHYLNKVDYVEDIFDRDDEFNNKKELPEEDSFEAIHSVATDKIQLELDFGREFALPEERNNKHKWESGSYMMEEDDENIPVYQKVENLKQDINELSRAIAMKQRKKGEKVDWNFAHKKWLNIGGKSIEKETIDELKKRKEWLYSQI